MGIKRYVFSAIVLIVLVGIYAVYEFQDVTHSLVFFGVTVTLPIVVWVLLPMVLLAVTTVLHLFAYGMKNYMLNRLISRDYNVFLASAKAALLNEKYDAKYKTKWFKLPNDMLLALKNPRYGSENLENEKLKQICEDIAKVEEEEYVNLKPYKLTSNNPLVVKNSYNQLLNDKDCAMSVIKNCSDLSDDLCKKAFEILVKNASYSEIKRQNIPLSFSHVMTILNRSIEDKDKLFIDDMEIDNLINSTEMNEDEYQEVANLVRDKLNPDMVFTIFEKAYEKNPLAGKAYIYVLLELQMIDKAREVLAKSEEGEYELLKAYLFLRDNGNNIDVKHFV